MSEPVQIPTRPDRDRISQNAPLLILLIAYLLLTVLMNVVFVVYGDNFGEYSIRGFSLSEFPTHTAGYWILLVLPFLLVPPIALFVRQILERRVAAIVGLVPEFRLFDYLVIAGACYAIVALQMYKADALGLLVKGADAISSVEARFELLNRLRFFERAILQSVLVFLTVYSLARSIRCRSLLWLTLFVANLIAMAILLILLNMKWPIVVLSGAIVATIALFSKRRVIYTAIGIVGMVCVYMFIGTMVLRLPSASPPSSSQPVPQFVPPPQMSRNDRAEAVFSFRDTVSAAISSSSFLAVTGLIRMAIPYPFYYRTFTTEGPICGTLLDRFERRSNPCQPSLLIYERMFGDDGFAGRGTVPAPFHVTGYALNGWIGAVVESVLTAIVIGIFMAVPAKQSAIASTFLVMGILSGYFFSQLPFEGPIVYDHGLLWWALLVLAYSLVQRLARAAQIRLQQA